MTVPRALLLALLLATGCRALPTAPWKRGCAVTARVTRPAPGSYDVALELRRDGKKLGAPRVVTRFGQWSVVSIGESLPVPPPQGDELEPGEDAALGLEDGLVVALRVNGQEAAEDRVDLELRVFVVERREVERFEERLDLALGEKVKVRD